MIEIDKKEQIIESAKKLFLHYGFKKTTMQDIAVECGMAVGTLYNFFKNKEEIVVACSEQCGDVLLEMIREIACSGLKPEKKLLEIMLLRSVYFLENFKDTAHGMELVTVILGETEEMHKRFRQQECKYVADVIEEGCEQGFFKVRKIDKTAGSFVMAFSGFALPHLLTMTESELKKGIKGMFEMLLPYLRGKV